MMDYDVFNGDADGLCALQQLRLAEPCGATLVTGVKRDIRLLDRVRAEAGDVLTVLDVSLDSNRKGLERALEAGARVCWFDHHFAGDIPAHANLEAHIDTAPEVCTSALVDRHLGGRFRRWAVVAAFGDNLPALGLRLALE
ncbi:MAG: acetyltransferase, partial [Rhodocyclales bacterium CG17_big_fil_post_rev_8_21_14_2_50_68_7]